LGFWERTLTVIALCGGAGAFIDFYIGKPGQQRVKSWLETWWLRFSDVRWNSFGREEALFAVRTLDWLFGRRLLSARRLIAVLGLTIVLSGFILAVLTRRVGVPPWQLGIDIGNFPYLIFSLFSFAVSFSITRFAANAVAASINRARYLNLVGFIFLMLFQYVILCYWRPITNILLLNVRWFLNVIYYEHKDLATAAWQSFMVWDYNAVEPGLSINHVISMFKIKTADTDDPILEYLENVSRILGLVPSVIRFLITSIFLGSLVLQPVQRSTITLWARIVESDKPVFTLLFGGAAAFAKIIQETAKLL
jgi:hypothetical protein